MKDSLKEAAERLFPNKMEEYDIFLIGARWQQERSYSEDDMKSAFLDGWELRDGDLPFPKAKKKWFEQFKNKV